MIDREWLSDEEVERIATETEDAGHGWAGNVKTISHHGFFSPEALRHFVNRLSLAVAKKALDGQKQLLRETEAMAECMDMVRQDLITAGVVDKSVPPMMLAEAVIAAQHMAVSTEREACARINADKSERLGQEAEEALKEGDRDTCISSRAAAHLLSVCAARIRARGTGGEG